MTYKEGELGKYAETQLQKLRTSIAKQLPEDTSDLSIHVYLLRHEHTIGNGKSVLVVNITEDSIEFTMRDRLNIYTSKDSEKSQNIMQIIVTIIKELFKSIGTALGV